MWVGGYCWFCDLGIVGVYVWVPCLVAVVLNWLICSLCGLWQFVFYCVYVIWWLFVFVLCWLDFSLIVVFSWLNGFGFGCC